MTEENNDTYKKQERYQKKFDPVGFILAFLLVGVIVVIAMEFLTPTIGNVFCIHDDICCGRFCSGIVNDCGPSSFLEGLPRGKLVLLAPKTTSSKKIRIIGFAYSPSIYSQDEVDELEQQYLQELRLHEDEAHIVKLDITMGEKGYPKIPTYIDTCRAEYNRYTNGKNLFIDPEGLTVWHLSYEIPNLQQDSHKITIDFVHDNPVFMEKTENHQEIRACSFICGRGGVARDGTALIEVEIQLSIWGWIQAIWLYYSPFSSIFLFSLIGLIVFLARKRIQKVKANHSLE